MDGVFNVSGNGANGSKVGTINGNLQINGTTTTTGDVVANGISVDSHTHGGVQSGGSNTAGPNG